MSGQKPAIVSSSSRFAASGDSGKTMPPTVRRTAILARAVAPFQRSIARVRARRTLTSSKGFLLWFGVTRLPQFRSLSLHGDLFIERTDELVARRGRQVAEIDRGAIAANGVDANRLLGSVKTGEAVEIGQSRMVIIRVAHALDLRTGLVADEFERSRTQDVLLVPARFLVEDLLLVNPGKRVGERRQKGVRRKLQ